jgi:hypothetical protein
MHLLVLTSVILTTAMLILHEPNCMARQQINFHSLIWIKLSINYHNKKTRAPKPMQPTCSRWLTMMVDHATTAKSPKCKCV